MSPQTRRQPITVRVDFDPPSSREGVLEGQSRPVGSVELDGRLHAFTGWVELVTALEDHLRASIGDGGA